jgi:hypothetical protein
MRVILHRSDGRDGAPITTLTTTGSYHVGAVHMQQKGTVVRALNAQLCSQLVEDSKEAIRIAHLVASTDVLHQYETTVVGSLGGHDHS